MQLSKSNWHNYKEQLYAEQRESNETFIYADKSCKGLHICMKYADTGIRIRLEHIGSKKENLKYFVRMVVNPRKLIYPQSGYLGILQPEEDNIELLKKAFRHQFRKSLFENELRKYYLSRVDLCTNIRCDNRKVFQSMENQQIKTDGLLKRFSKLGISPIPLRQGYAAERMPSLSEILQTVADKPIVVDLHCEKWK